MKRTTASRHQPISQATIESWHFEKLLFGLSIYQVTSIKFSNWRIVDVCGDHEDAQIQLIYSASDPEQICEIHFSSSPSATGMVVRCPQRIEMVKAALRALLSRTGMLAEPNLGEGVRPSPR